MNSRSCSKTALALVALAILATGTAWGQFANDGAFQKADGTWGVDTGSCAQTALGDARADCRSVIFSRTGAEDPLYDTSGECTAAGREWTNGPNCTNYWLNANQATCEGGGGVWATNICRGLWAWAGTYPASSNAAYRSECMRCHNDKYYAHEPEFAVNSYVMTGHKNMQRPVVPDTNTDPHYLANAPWADKTGAVITQDIFGQAIDFTAATVETAPGVYADLFYLRDWIADYPEPIYTGGEADSCARCHSTGYQAEDAAGEAGRLPFSMFAAITDAQVTGSWEQWGIQCARCHGSQMVVTPSGISPLKGDLRHHPDLVPNKAAIGGSYANEAMCECLTALDSLGVCPAGFESGLTWGEFGGTPTKRCFDPTLDNNPPIPPDLTTECQDALGSWDSTNSVCYFSMFASGATRTNLCADCHISGASNPAGEQRVGSQHGLELDFTGHFQSNQFLNSPHARFTTAAGNGLKIGDKTKYDTHFQFEGESFPFDNTIRNKGLQGGCTQCHNVHKSALAEANPDGGAIHEECTECHAKNLTAMFHPAGKGTPMEEMGIDPNEACVICHMPRTEDGRPTHFFRVNVDPAYEMFPPTMFNLPVPSGLFANTATDDGYTKAVWNDLDHTCGQCHGGGTEYKLTSGTIAAGSNLLTVADATGFVGGERVVVAGAGEGGADLLTWVSNVPPAGGVVTLVEIPMAATAVSGAEVVMNPTTNGAGYISKAQLAVLATGIHGDAPVASFTYTLGNPNTQQVNFSAAASTCGGSAANCNLFAWEFGDGQTGTGIAPVHTYAAAGTYEVVLTVTQYGVGEGEKEKSVTTYEADLPPVLAAGCSFDNSTWMMTVTDNGSTDDHALTQGVVEWGDGSLKSSDFTPPFGPFTHTYTAAGNFVVTYKIADSVGQIASMTCFANPSTFSVGGVVHKVDHLTPVGGVTIKLWDGTKVVKTVYTDVAGTFTATNIKPGNYTLLVTKSGWSFPNPAIVVPVAAPVDIDALANAKVVKGGGRLGNSKSALRSN